MRIVRTSAPPTNKRMDGASSPLTARKNEMAMEHAALTPAGVCFPASVVWWGRVSTRCHNSASTERKAKTEATSPARK